MEGVRTILRGEGDYPEALLRVPQPPVRLRLRGCLAPAKIRRVPRVAVVGSRECDEYGLEMARAIAGGLARAGVSVMSGGAEGVDSAAHQGALESGGHTTVVLGGGMGHLYPASNRDLFARVVAQGGALLTEYDDDFHATTWSFPQRNRIVAGLSEAVVVVRARERSGALITAEWARKLGVPLLAVPGDARSDLSAGPHGLLRQGARLAASASDVLNALGLAGQLELPAADPVGLDADASALYRVLGREPRHADDVARAAGLLPGPALAALLALELQGLCEQRPGHYFLRRT
jgi:DNA processing protein